MKISDFEDNDSNAVAAIDGDILLRMEALYGDDDEGEDGSPESLILMTNTIYSMCRRGEYVINHGPVGNSYLVTQVVDSILKSLKKNQTIVPSIHSKFFDVSPSFSGVKHQRALLKEKHREHSLQRNADSAGHRRKAKKRSSNLGAGLRKWAAFQFQKVL